MRRKYERKKILVVGSTKTFLPIIGEKTKVRKRFYIKLLLYPIYKMQENIYITLYRINK